MTIPAHLVQDDRRLSISLERGAVRAVEHVLKAQHDQALGFQLMANSPISSLGTHLTREWSAVQEGAAGGRPDSQPSTPFHGRTAFVDVPANTIELQASVHDGEDLLVTNSGPDSIRNGVMFKVTSAQMWVNTFYVDLDTIAPRTRAFMAAVDLHCRGLARIDELVAGPASSCAATVNLYSEFYVTDAVHQGGVDAVETLPVDVKTLALWASSRAGDAQLSGSVHHRFEETVESHYISVWLNVYLVTTVREGSHRRVTANFSRRRDFEIEGGNITVSKFLQAAKIHSFD